ncbi:hypothetical protein CWR43_24580 [Rhizobium sullae]|uniref:Uncharacterized protein n=1 Tax=Rhizobium sullae TaxID=50338 RepID=A0A2N0D416_RHISU|nr:hypothetical protein CWR43_24580 [Rhizobium sullae]
MTRLFQDFKIQPLGKRSDLSTERADLSRFAATNSSQPLAEWTYQLSRAYFRHFFRSSWMVNNGIVIPR